MDALNTVVVNFFSFFSPWALVKNQVGTIPGFPDSVFLQLSALYKNIYLQLDIEVQVKLTTHLETYDALLSSPV